MVRWSEITEAVGVALTGDRARGTILLTQCWVDTTDQDHGQRCVIAHYLADLQDHLDDEVSWDERALIEHGQVADDDLTAVGISSALLMAPSLHLNLGDGYLRQGRVGEASAHVQLGLSRAPALSRDGYGAMIRAGLEGLRARVDAAALPADELGTGDESVGL